MAERVHHWRDPGPIARLTLWAVAANALVSVAYFGTDFYYRPQFDSDTPDPVYEALSSAYMLLSLLAFAPGCIWLYRVSANARSWDREMKYGPVWAWLWFMVPVAHFFMPFLALSEIYRVSRARSRIALVLFWIVNVISLAVWYTCSIWVLLINRHGDNTFWAEQIGTLVGLAVHPFFAWLVIDLTSAQQNSTRIAEAFSDQPAAQPA